jgi:hypothetical protein
MNEQNPPDVPNKEEMAPTVPLLEWKSLHELASNVRQNEPWQTLTDTDLFALEDPATKQVGLVSVLGNLGELYAVQLYLPPEGLLFWLQFFRKDAPNPILAQFELRMLEAAFVTKKQLQQPDLIVLEELGLGRPKKRLNGYAQFRSYRPRCLPWYLDADEVRLLRTALGACLEFAARRNRREERWLLDDSTGNELPVVSVYSPVEEPLGWSVRRERIRVEGNSLVTPPISEVLDEATLHRLAVLSVKHGVWQAGAFYIPAPITGEDRPVYPVAALVVDESNTEVLEVALTSDLKIQAPWTVVRAIAAAAMKRDGFPKIIRVATSEAKSALESLREFCPGLRLELSKKLDSLNLVVSDLRATIADAYPTDPKANLEELGSPRAKRSSDDTSSEAFKTTTYRLKVTLRHSKPSIWRRLVVSGDILLSDLHYVLQIAMGWFDMHLHEFQDRSNRYSDPKSLDGVIDENARTLRQIAPRKKSRFVYTYDFGDNWEHDIVVEEIERSSVPVMPSCIGGRNACPPEDSGGVFGYLSLLESLADADHANHDEARDWIGEDFDQTYFDPAEANAVLGTLPTSDLIPRTRLWGIRFNLRQVKPKNNQGLMSATMSASELLERLFSKAV